MVALRELCDRRLATTLVPSDIGKKLGNQLVVVMNKSGQIYPDSSQSKPTRPFDIESILWKDVPCASIGRAATPLHSDRLSNKEEPAVATKIGAAEREGSYLTLEEWIERSATTVRIATDPFLPISGRHSEQKDGVDNKCSVNEAIEQNLDLDISPRKRGVKARKDQGAIGVSQPVWAQIRVQNNEGNLLDLNASTPFIEEKAKHGITQHILRNTMKHRKAPLMNCPFPGEIGVLKQYDDTAAQLLSMVRTTQGQIKLEVIIGRLMIDHQSDSLELKKTFAVGQWPTNFLDSSTPVRLRSFITNRLTSFGSDADFISQLELSSGRSMFTREPCEREAFYRLKCFSALRAHSTMVIDIYEDGTHKLQSTELLNGAVDLHFAKRYWDARIAIITSQSVDDERYAKAAQFMAENFCVIPNASHLDMFTNVNPKIIDLQSIEIRRETRHRSVNYPDLLLKLSEVQELSFEVSAAWSEECCYHAWTKPKPDTAKEGKLWWEVSLASVNAEKILKENETLELGEMSIWKSSDIIDASIVRNMSHLARDIVTRIDSVGYHNKGPMTGTSKEVSERAVANLGFW